MSGQKVSGNAEFFIGTADAPIDPPAGWTPKRLKEKIAGGAQFAQTQFCMDANVVKRYAQCLADNGISNFYLLIGIAPLRSARSARWIREKLFGSIIPDAVVERLERAEDPVREGRRICIELVEQLSGHTPRLGRARDGTRQRHRPRRGRRRSRPRRSAQHEATRSPSGRR